MMNMMIEKCCVDQKPRILKLIVTELERVLYAMALFSMLFWRA